MYQGDDLKAETTRLRVALPEGIPHEEPRKITDEEKEFEAFHTLRVARAEARYDGKRKIRAAKVRALRFNFDHLLTIFPLCRRRRRRPTRRSNCVVFVSFLLYHYISPLSSVCTSKFLASDAWPLHYMFHAML